jgi:formamidopyrimidine-DNA glycosylase
MPELPEVEVTRRGIAPHVEGRTVTGVVMRRSGLRWPFPPDLPALLTGRTIESTGRRGKYLLLRFAHGTLIVHLGMSGHLRILAPGVPVQKHDHFDLELGSQLMRFTDPRRFGAVLWHAHEDGAIDEHMLLRGLGVEPLGTPASTLTSAALAQMLHRQTRSRSAAIKQVLLAGDIVVGVGNIYACESLFMSAINPNTAARRISLARYERLAAAIQQVLAAAIEQGGSSLRDFIGADGASGYFQQNYFVYDREGEPCRHCGAAVRRIVQGQRSTFYCVRCQK